MFPRLAITVCAIALVLYGCTTPVKISDAESAPIAQEFSQQQFKESATIVVVRDAGLLASMNDFVIYLGNRTVGVLKPGQKLSFTIPAGSYIIGVGCNPCREDHRSELQLVALAGKQHAYRASWGSEGVKLQASAQIDN
jgi:hypothetical protein